MDIGVGNEPVEGIFDFKPTRSSAWRSIGGRRVRRLSGTIEVLGTTFRRMLIVFAHVSEGSHPARRRA